MRSLVLGLCLLAFPAWAQDYPPELPPIVAPEDAMRAFLQVPDVPVPVVAGEPVVIRILVALASGVSTAHCADGIARTNRTLTNSRTPGALEVQVVLAECLPTTYVSSGSAATDLSRITNGRFIPDGFMDEVHAERDRVGADTVVLVGKSSDSCGIAYLNVSETRAFAYVMDGCLPNHSFQHEWAHNMGLNHDEPNATSCYLTFSCGFCFGNGRKCVMTYPSPCGGSRVERYSNPLVLDLGVPSGTSRANGWSVIEARAPVVANFRPEPSSLTAPTNHLR